MPQFYGVKELNSLSDWESIVPSQHWVPSRSAYELAHHWFRCDRFPPRVRAVLETAFPRLSPKHASVELPVFLDTFKAPSRTDIMLYCRTQADEPFIVGVEGKATEPFDKPVSAWVRDGGLVPTPTRSRRLQFLSELIGIPVSPDCTFGYQLVHRTASVVSECLLRGATSGVLLIHSFSEAAPDNWTDFQSFAALLGIQTIQKDALAGPVLLGPKRDVQLSLAWINDEPTQPVA